MSEKEIVRAPAVAGMFYEKSPDALRKTIDEMLSRVELPKVEGTVCGLVSPHAGYVYSGFTAAHAFKLLEGRKYDCVITVGPSHREYFDGISIYSGDAYETPLGKVPINHEIRSELLHGEKNITASVAGHRAEHSLEVQLPFLQRVLKEFSVVPIIMGDQRRQLCEQLSAVLARVMANKNVLLVASSDLSHFHTYDEAVYNLKFWIEKRLEWIDNNIAKIYYKMPLEIIPNGSIDNRENFSVFPNPFMDQLNLEYNITQSGLFSFEIFDLYGRKFRILENAKLNKENSNFIIETNTMQNLAKGIYILAIYKNNYIIYEEKIVKY